MYLIVAVDSKYGIGKQGKLLGRFPEDMRRFKDITTERENSVVIMGRKTYESLPSLLRDRLNVILTSNKEYKAEGATVCYSPKKINHLVCREHYDKNVFVIGGAEIYRLFMPYCTHFFVTHIKKNCQADVFIPELKKELNECEVINREEYMDGVEKDIKCEFVVYERKMK